MPVREMLTLIPVFDAILSEGSISRAADRLGVTQSAVSQSLARLRRLANDDLFETTGRGVRPTPRALEMAAYVRSALAQVNAAIAPKEIDVANLERTFVLDIGAGFDALVIPVLLAELSHKAPGVRLLVSNTRGADLLNELKYGETELAFDFRPTTPRVSGPSY
ncbi:MAG: LysR family transcriptional regulator [Rhodospirillales bacterium]|nr:LysR family transcriptional regulator [Rhodospirillales bacterium]